jgi:anionic cell wall polymer biosynthesis LytR-Cps2A-Psr (LCP) family protein/uncharacterized protein YraI
MKQISLIHRTSIALLIMASVFSSTGTVKADTPKQDPAPTQVPIPSQARKLELPAGTFNVALLGVDKRPDKSFNNTDVIIIASVNPEVPSVTMLSIPRDTPAYIPGVGVRKINTAYGFGGADLFKQTILYNYGIEVQSYALVNFTGVVHAVDTLGGVDVIATCPLQHAFPKDPYYMGDISIVREPHVDTFTGETWQVGTKVPRLELNLPKPGVYTLDGLQSLAFVRARKGIPGGDVDRGRREQRLVRGMLQKAKQIGSFTKLTELYSKLKGDVETDMTLEQILRFAGLADKLGDAIVRSYYLTGYDSNGAALPDAPEPGLSRQQYLQKALTVAVNARANDGIPVVLLNGTNDAGFIAAVSARLKEVGFVVQDVRPADKPYASTVVLDHTTTTKGYTKIAPLLQSAFDIKANNIVKQPQEGGPRYTITVGADFNTCYFAKTLQGSGSETIEATSNPEETKIASLPSTINVTSTVEITQPIVAPAVAMTATELLQNTASSRLAPVMSSDAFTPTMSVQKGDLVNVRSGPGIRFRTLGRLVGGQDAAILGRSYDGDWLNIRMPDSDRLGWVKAEVVKVVDEPPPATATSVPVVSGTAEPAGTPEPITVIDPATAPTETALPLPPVPTNTPAPRATADALNARVFVPRGDVVNLRSGPGTNFRVIGRMFARQSASIIGRTQDGGWWQIRTGGGAAWVAAGIVRVSGDINQIPVTR